MTSTTPWVAVSALLLGLLAAPAEAGHDHPRYVTPHVHDHGHVHPGHRGKARGHHKHRPHRRGHDHRHDTDGYGYRGYDPYLGVTLQLGHGRVPLAYRRDAWRRHLPWHDRYFGGHCAFRHTPHRHVNVGGRLVIRLDW